MRVILTGANGFIGRAATSLLLKSGHVVRVVTRQPFQCGSTTPTSGDAGGKVEQVVVGDIGAAIDWGRVSEGADAVVHLAARVHRMRAAANSITEFRRVNVVGTLNLAREAARSGVRRFVFVSSIKVNGERTLPGRPYRADDTPAPIDAYALSKCEAEEGLRELAHQTGLQVVIIRPVLVYGPGVKANFASMMRWLRTGIPLPLGAIHNRRSLVAVDNLIDLIATCLRQAAAANQTFLVSDGEDLSTTQLLQLLGNFLGRPARLIPVPVPVLEAAAAVIGRRDMVQRLCGTLQVDISKARDLLGWSPPITINDGLRRTARAFLNAMKV